MLALCDNLTAGLQVLKTIATTKSNFGVSRQFPLYYLGAKFAK